MSLRAVRGLLFGSLVVGLTTVGCGDGDGNDNDGKGGMDAGSDAGADAGGKLDSGADGTVTGDVVTCGGETCTGGMLGSNKVTACCATGDVCGLNAGDVPESPFQGCLPKNVFPDAPTSAHCGAFWDQAEPDLKTEHLLQGKTNADIHSNGGFDIGNALVGNLTFNGCCVPSGECGVRLTEPINFPGINLELGCMSLSALQMATGGGGGTPSGRPAPTVVPFCNPTTGEPPTMGTVPGVPRFVCGCGVGKTDPGTGLPCLSDLPAEVCGANDPTAEQLAKIPAFMCGEMGQTTSLPTLRNLPSTTCGTKPITTDSPELALIPEFICGEVGATPTGLPMLRNVQSTVCGKKPITAASPELAAVPALLCGCEDATPSGYPCLAGVAKDVCGGSLAQIPAIVRGCGETTALNPYQSLCIPYKANTVTGTKAVMADETKKCIASVPEYVFGCGDTTPNETTNPCLPGLPRYPGCDAVTAGTVRAVPDFVCGCGDNVVYNPAVRGILPCISNVPKEVCGIVPTTANPVPNLPEYVCGCGADKYYEGLGTPCLAKKPVDLCGAVNTATAKRDFGDPVQNLDCLAGVPEYATGCGDGPQGLPNASIPGDPCLRQAGLEGAASPAAPGSRLYGCVNLPANSKVPGVLANICGCGENTPYLGGSTVCLSWADSSVCGAVPVP